MMAVIRVALLLLGGACPALGKEVHGTEQSQRVRRGLLPSPPHLGSHPPGPLGHAKSKKYMGCLGLSAEELEEASQFKEDMPKCEIVVDGTTVASNTLPSNSPAESDSSISDFATTTSSTVTSSAYEEANGGTSGGSDDNFDDQNDEVDENDEYGDGGDQSGGETNYDDDTIDSIEDGSTSENVESSGNEATSDDTFTENQGSNSSTAVDEDESPNPLHLFDMNDCGSFSAIWMWDLAITCFNSTSLESCSCTAAKILIQYGDIDCMTDECPADCSVCDMCMKLSGCGPTKELQRSAATDGDDSAGSVPVAFIGLTAAMFGIQLVLFKVYWSRRSQPGGTLGSHLLYE